MNIISYSYHFTFSDVCMYDLSFIRQQHSDVYTSHSHAREEIFTKYATVHSKRTYFQSTRR